MSEPVVTVADGGAEIVRTAEDAALLGSQVQDPSIREAAGASERRRAMFGTSDHAISTFAEGIVDALSMGLIRETGDVADLRRSENGGWAMAGNAVGFAAGMVGGGPVRAITHAAEDAGRAAAKTFLRSGEKSLVSRGIQEATSSAALAGGQAFGHQLMDSIIEDKEFSSEAILDEVKLAGVMGAVGGVAMGGLSKLVSRQADIVAQGGLVGSFDDAIKPHREVVSAYDEVVTRHGAEVGVLRELHAQGHIPFGVVEPRIKAYRNAVNAREALDSINETRALSGTDDTAYKKWQKAGVRHRAAVRELDAAMQGKLPDSIAPGRPVSELDEMLARSPEARAASVADEAAEGAYPASFDETHLRAQDEALPTLRSAADEFDVMSRENPRRAGELDADIVAARAAENAPLGNLPLDRPGIGKRYKGKLVGESDRLAGGLRPGKGYQATGLVEDVGRVPSELERLIGLQRDAGVVPRRDPNMATGQVPVSPDIAPAAPTAQTVGGKLVQGVDDLADYHSGYPNMGPGTGPAPGKTSAATPRAAANAAEDAAIPVHQEWENRLTADDPHPRQLSGVDVPVDDLVPGAAFDAPPAKPRPLDVADSRVQAAMAELETKSGGRLNSAGGLGILEQAGIRPAADNVGAYMDQVYALRKAARLTTKPTGPLKGAMGNAVAAGVGAVVGGPIGMAMNLMYLKRAGRIAAASGRLMARVGASVDRLLTSKRIRSVAAAVANKPHEYSDRGPIADPVERIQELQFLAAHPEAITARVADSAKGLADEPQMLQALQQRAVNQVQRLAVRAPAIYFDKLGRALNPAAGRMRDFLEYENATHDLGGILDAIGAGTVTKAQSDALKDNWTSVSVKMASAFLMDPDKLKGASRETLRVVEMVSGFPLTNASDPLFLARQGMAWQPAEAPTQGVKPQAFNINPAGNPTPSQSNATGRAPGN